MTTNKLQYAGSVILSSYIPENYPSAWVGGPPQIMVISTGGRMEDENGVTAFVPAASITMRFWRSNEAEIDSLIETLQAIKACIASPERVDDNPLEF